jgi:hypothetical protein
MTDFELIEQAIAEQERGLQKQALSLLQPLLISVLGEPKVLILEPDSVPHKAIGIFSSPGIKFEAITTLNHRQRCVKPAIHKNALCKAKGASSFRKSQVSPSATAPPLCHCRRSIVRGCASGSVRFSVRPAFSCSTRCSHLPESVPSLG